MSFLVTWRRERSRLDPDLAFAMRHKSGRPVRSTELRRKHSFPFGKRVLHALPSFALSRRSETREENWRYRANPDSILTFHQLHVTTLT